MSPAFFLPVLEFTARNRVSLAISCFLAAVFMYVYQAELDPPPVGSIEVQDVVASAVGSMEVYVRGRRDDVKVARREAGFGMEFTPIVGKEALSPPLVARMQFASELELTAAEINWIRGHGPTYRIGIIRQQVVFIGSKTQPLIPYERYAKAASSLQGLWKALAVFAVVLGFGLYAAGHTIHRRADA